MDIFNQHTGEIETLELRDFDSGENIAKKFLSRWIGINSISTLVTHADEATNGVRYNCVGNPSKGQRIMHQDDIEMYREMLNDEQSNIQMEGCAKTLLPSKEYKREKRLIDDAFKRHMEIDQDVIFCMQAAIENKANQLNAIMGKGF